MEPLKLAFRDICAGYFSFKYLDSTVFAKHLTRQDSYFIDLEYDKYYDRAAKRNIPSRNEKLEELDKNGEWTSKNDQELKEHEDYIKNLHVTLSNLVFEKQRISIKKQIEEAEKRKNEILYRKLSLMGITREKYAEDKANEFYIYFSTYRDKELTQRLFDYEEFDDLKQEEIYSLMTCYAQGLGHLSVDNIKKIAISDFFTSVFYLLGENYYLFFNKPILELTYNQVNLLNYGIYYKKLIQNNDLPDEILKDPSKIEEYVNNTKNVKEVLNRSQNQHVGVVGGKKDMEKFTGKNPLSNPVMEYMKKKGSIHGIDEAVRATERKA